MVFACLPRGIHRLPANTLIVDFRQAFDIKLRLTKGIVPLAGDHILRRSPMKKLLSAMVMAMFLVGFVGGAFADEMKGEKKDEMKGEMKGDHKDMKKDEKKAEKKEDKKKK
jgi:hypothetical protein